MAKRVFFSFHYKDVIDFRANVVRNHRTTKGKSAGYFDASIWEDAKKDSPLALKRLINKELENTSVTAVLIGSDTFNRRWVNYEIIKSVSKGNKIIGIHINSVKGKDEKTKQNGLNPFSFLGYKYSSDGKKLEFFHYTKGNWIKYTDYEGYNLTNTVEKEKRGKIYQFSNFCKTFDWVKDNGYENFSKWID